jgi:hypothetical protein
MDAREKQMAELLSLTARSLTHLTASITAMSFELIASEDKVVRAAGKRMITRMAAVNTELDQQWQIISQLSGVMEAPPHSMEEVLLQPLVLADIQAVEVAAALDK